MELALKEYDIPLMKTTVGNRNIYENSSSGLSVLELAARSASAREGQREMRELVAEIEGLIGVGDNRRKTAPEPKNKQKKSADV